MNDPIRNDPIRNDPSLAARLRTFTSARVGLGRTGVSQVTRDVLQFQLAHARARDAVHARLDAGALAAQFATLEGFGESCLRLRTAAVDRSTYLQRPDLGRTLDAASRSLLAERASPGVNLAIVAADGLSALAVERHAAPLLRAFLAAPQFPFAALETGTKTHTKTQTMAPVCIVEQGRVAVGDEIGALLAADVVVVLIGERPGLSSPDSLGAYITWQPRPGRTDAERVCISNIRPEGLPYEQAASLLARAVADAQKLQFTGVLHAPRTRALP